MWLKIRDAPAKEKYTKLKSKIYLFHNAKQIRV